MVKPENRVEGCEAWVRHLAAATNQDVDVVVDALNRVTD